MSKKIISGLLATVFMLPAIASIEPTMLNGDARIVEFEYNPDQIYPILTRPFAHTNIGLAKGERVRTIMAGDTKSFIIHISKSKDEIFIKPKFEGVETTLTVITDKRKYQYLIRSTGKGRKYYQQVSFAGPEEEFFEFENEATDSNLVEEDKRINTNSSVPNSTSVDFGNLNTNYTITGEADFKPISVYDNGTLMWIKFNPKLTELPAIFGVSDDKKYLVNYTVDKNNIVIIQQLVKELALKIDTEEVSIKRGRKTLFGWSD